MNTSIPSMFLPRASSARVQEATTQDVLDGVSSPKADGKVLVSRLFGRLKHSRSTLVDVETPGSPALEELIHDVDDEWRPAAEALVNVYSRVARHSLPLSSSAPFPRSARALPRKLGSNGWRITEKMVERVLAPTRLEDIVDPISELVSAEASKGIGINWGQLYLDLHAYPRKVPDVWRIMFKTPASSSNWQTMYERYGLETFRR